MTQAASIASHDHLDILSQELYCCLLDVHQVLHLNVFGENIVLCRDRIYSICAIEANFPTTVCELNLATWVELASVSLSSTILLRIYRIYVASV